MRPWDEVQNWPDPRRPVPARSTWGPPAPAVPPIPDVIQGPKPRGPASVFPTRGLPPPEAAGPVSATFPEASGAVHPTDAAAPRTNPHPPLGNKPTVESRVAKVAAEGIAQLARNVEGDREVQTQLASAATPPEALSVLKGQADATGFGTSPAKLYRSKGGDVDRDFNQIVEQYGFNESVSSDTAGTLDEDEKAAFLLDMGLRMMAAGGAPGAAAHGFLGILGGAAIDSMEQVRQRRQARLQERRELGKLVMAERRDRRQQARADRQVALDEERHSEQVRANKAREKYYQAQLAQGTRQQLSADMQLLGYFEDMVAAENPDMPKGQRAQKAVELARRYSSTSTQYSGPHYKQQNAHEAALEAVKAFQSNPLNARDTTTSPTDIYEETFRKTFDLQSKITQGESYDVPDDPAEIAGWLQSMQESEVLAFINSETYSILPERIKAEIHAAYGL